MHESAVARQILDVVLREATVGGAVRVLVVRGHVSEDESLSAESIQLHFSRHAVGTMAAEARLELELRVIPARCLACGQTYVPQHHICICPHCESADGRLLEPPGLAIESMDVEPAADRGGC